MEENVSHENSVPFGFETVSHDEKVSRVKGVFRSVSDRYDLMNDLMSVGIHRLWKHDAMARLNPQPGETLLDVAGGTGDLAKAWLERADRVARRRGNAQDVGRRTRAIICDINDAMLMSGQRRDDMTGLPGALDWVCADATALPFPDRSVDAVSIALGIRNVADRAAALKEFRRVLRPAGRLAVLEFSHMTAPLLQRAYDAYSFAVIPRLGGMVTGDAASYQYLVESIRTFPDQDAFKGEIEAAGFGHVSVTNFTGGIVALHVGWAA